MATEPNILPNINLGNFNPVNGWCSSMMLGTLVGFPVSNINSMLSTAISIGVLPAPDFAGSGSMQEALWYPATIAPYLSASTTASIRLAVNNAYLSGRSKPQ